MQNPIHPCLWFDGNARAAADFYCGIFENSRITVDTPVVVNFELFGQKFMGLNGGPMFKTNPSISLFITCDTEEEIHQLWTKLSTEASVMMPLNTYPWSEKYGWLNDKFGVSWQIYKGKLSEVKQKISPCLLFVNNHYGQAEKAVGFYTSVFPHSSTAAITFYGEGEPQPLGKVKHARFVLNGAVFMAMDGLGEMPFNFTEGTSFVVECNSQAEIDDYWNKLTEGGEESMCGWLKDQFGVSWQIVPAVLGELMQDAVKGPKVMQAFLKMRKFDIAKLLEAANA